ncbi:MAG: shikimate kinase [Lachnospiraceae bacterium]|jgi:shikimate kinase|nr:shikimate kinase [Lachnospiraceae bacterium]
MNIIFIGMPAVGKSTIGVVLAKRLGFQYIDPDLLIQEKEGKLLSEIIEAKGIDCFLKLEDEVNSGINSKRAVISPGGSVVYCDNAMRHYKEIGVVVYLKVSFEEIRSRIESVKNRGVVLKEGQTLLDLYRERERLFEKWADITIIEDGHDLEETVQMVLDEYQKIL